MICGTCRLEKPLEEFYQSKKTKCKKCCIKATLSKRNAEYYKEYQKKYYPEWYKKNGRLRTIDFNLINREWRLKNPEKYKAHTILNNALRLGKIFKPQICQTCMLKKPLFGHHDNYNEPLNVLWLCGSCHKLIHLA